MRCSNKMFLLQKENEIEFSYDYIDRIASLTRIAAKLVLRSDKRQYWEWVRLCNDTISSMSRRYFISAYIYENTQEYFKVIYEEKNISEEQMSDNLLNGIVMLNFIQTKLTKKRIKLC